MMSKEEFEEFYKNLESQFRAANESGFRKFNIWLPIDKLPIEPSDVLITHRAVPDETQIKVWIPTEYFEKYRRGYQAFKKKKEKEQNND